MQVLEENTPKSSTFRQWRAASHRLSSPAKRFDEWFFLNTASVLLSEKTGELLACDLNEFGMDVAGVAARLGELCRQWSVDFSLLYESNGLLKFIVYESERLAGVLVQAPFCVMGIQLKYAYPLTPESFLGELEFRWNESGRLPHEIGVALGYPLDDVFGFMGLLPLSCKGTCGWQVFGCLKQAQELSGRFNQARCQALVMLSQTAISA